MMRLEVRNTQSRDGDHIWKTLNEYFRTYWSGLDSRIYLGDQLLDEVIELQWTLQEAVMPLYGYHSYVFDSALHGARRVQGAFRINFTQNGYLFDLIRKISRPVTPPPLEEEVTSQEEGEAFRIAKTGEASLETFTGLSAKEGGGSVVAAPPGPRLGGASVIAAGGNNRLKFDSKAFDDTIRGFKRALWGPQGVFPNGRLRNPFAPQRAPDPPVDLPLIPGPTIEPTRLDPSLLPPPQFTGKPHRDSLVRTLAEIARLQILAEQRRRNRLRPKQAVKGFREEFIDGNTLPVAPELTPGVLDNEPKFELPGGFDINIVFGSVDPQLIRRRKLAGNVEEFEEVRIPISTSRKIVGIEITGVESVYDDSGRPILETYTFLARDII